MMRSIAKNFKSISRRTLSVILAVIIFVSMILAVVSGFLFVSIAGNPATVAALNQSVPVQQINLMPVDPAATNSRTTLYAGTNDKASGSYSKITVNEDQSVDFTLTKDSWHNNTNTDGSHDSSDTSFVEAFTLINQHINLAENPWLMTRWSGSGRSNGRIYFTVTYNGVEYGSNNTVIGTTTVNGKTVSVNATKTQQELLTNGHLFSIPLSNIINNNSAGYKYTNQTQTDFNASSVQDFTVDFYKYLCEQVALYNDGIAGNGGISLSSSHWPSGEQWNNSAKYHVTVYMSCQIIASEAGKPLTKGTNVHWEQFSLGREVMDRPASMLPRAAEFMNITDLQYDDAKAKGVDYGRVSASADGSVTFSNTSSSKEVWFGWNLRRYFNASELESLHVEATFSGMTAEQFDMFSWYGGRVATTMDSNQKAYSYRGFNVGLQSMLSNYSRSKQSTANSLTAVIDFNRICKAIPDDANNYTEKYKTFYPDDSLVFVNDIRLKLPAGAKITFNRLEFQVENEEIPATKVNTAYPWYSNNLPDGLPPVGTPVYSTALNGASGRSYDWATDASDAPVVAQKVDMLSMKTFSFNKWNHTEIKNANDETVDQSLYERYADGSSVYSNSYDYSAFYSIMRYGKSDEWNRNFYIYLDMEDVPYLYYSYEIMKEDESDLTEPKAGFYFHINNARRDRYTKSSSERPWAYQYYLDHSGIGLNECSSVYALGNNSSYFEYGTNAILSNSKLRTGCVDVSSLYVKGESDTIDNGEYLQLEELRVYLGPNTKIKINYFFFGGESLSESVVGSEVPVTAGDAYPWAVTKDTFDTITGADSDNAQYTFANKIDLLSTLQDLEDLNDILASSTKDENNAYTSIGSVNPNDGYPYDSADQGKGIVTVDPATKAVKLKVTDTSNLESGYRFKAGTSLDYYFRININTSDLSSIRYLNYSVDAPQGMRWAIMFSEPNDGTMRRAITTWCDSDAKWGDDEDIYTSAPAGKTYFRMSTSGGYAGPNATANAKSEYDTYWHNKNNSSWRLYAIPGSQTGCIDMTQVTSDFSWNNGMISVYLVAYRDPTFTSKKTYGSTEAVDPTVTFNYLYMTSTPIRMSDVGKGADKAGTIYNWGAEKVTAPSVSQKVDFLPAYSSNDVSDWGETVHVDYFPHGFFDLLDGTITEGDGADTGSATVNSSGSIVVKASAEYSFNITYNQQKRFNANTLNLMHLNVSASTSPYRIALQICDKNNKSTWLYLTKNNNYAGWKDLPYATVGTDSNLLPSGERVFTLSYENILSDSGLDTSEIYIKQMSVRFKASSSSSEMTINTLRTQNQSVNLSNTPYLYYSYRLVDKQTGKTVSGVLNDNGGISNPEYLRIGMSIMDTNTSYYFRTMTGYDSAGTSGYSSAPNGSNYGYGKPSFIRLSTSSSNYSGKMHEKSPSFVYGSESGCIDMRQYHSNSNTMTLNYVRFYLEHDYYFDTSRYDFVVDYLFLGSEASHKSLSKFTGSNDFSDSTAPVPSDYQVNVVGKNTSLNAGSTTISPSITVDLNKTPYLFYSIKYNAGQTGTFGLTLEKDGSSVSFYRDVGRKTGHLISKGTNPSQYLRQSETGCIDVRSWNREEGLTSADIVEVTKLHLYNSPATVVYMYFGAQADKTIDLIPEKSRGTLDNGLPTKTWVVLNQSASGNMEIGEDGNYDTASNTEASSGLGINVDFKGDITSDSFNDLWIDNKDTNAWSQIYLSYGNIMSRGARSTGGAYDFAYRSTGNNQMTGLMVDLNETPYLHFSFDQPENSRTSMLLQLNDWTSTQSMLGKTANQVRPWLSMYCPSSPAGQLLNIVSSTDIITFYKDDTMVRDAGVFVDGNQGGVIDLRSWYTVTNGCSNVISLDSIRFYTLSPDDAGEFIGTDLKINYMYLSSSSSAAFSVTFHKNYDDADGDTSNDSYTQYVLQNANEQYISDEAVSNFKERKDENGNKTHTFLGWYTDPECENYFDIKGTPMTDNIDLYARWIDNDTIPIDVNKGDKWEDFKELNLLAAMDNSQKVFHSGSEATSEIVFDDEALTVKNKGTENLIVEFPVNKSYSISALRSLFMGFDNNLTCAGFDITMNAKSTTSRSYSLIQDAFYQTYLTDDKLLTAAPHDGESAFYTYLGVRDDLPVRENEQNLIEVKSITLTVPVGVSAEIRYIKAGNEMALLGKSDVRAPASYLTDTFDLLNNENHEASFVKTSSNIVYNELQSKSVDVNGNEYTQVSIHAREDGYVHIGGLYSESIDMTIVDKGAEGDADYTVNPRRWLQFSVDQSADSYFTFALYASFNGIVEGKNQGVRDEYVYDIHTPKSVSYFDSSIGTNGALVTKSLDSDAMTFIPAQSAYINGSKVYWLDLYNWYKDALTPYRSNSEVREVKLLGLRFFTDKRSTDATINYMFIGSGESVASSSYFDCFVEYPYRAGSGIAKWYTTDSQGNKVVRPNVPSDPFQMLGYVHKGDVFYVSLDKLSNLKDDLPIDNPKKQFLGWVFRDMAVDGFRNQYIASGMTYDAADAEAIKPKSDEQLIPYLIYWNPNPENGNMYDPVTNKGGSWSKTPVEGFVTDRKSVYYTFSVTHGNTQVIIPIFADADYTPTLTVTPVGGSVTVSSPDVTTVGTNQWTAPFGTEVVVSASGTDFAGWYDEQGVLLSLSKDYRLNLMADTELVAKFSTLEEDQQLEYWIQEGRSIIWLQSESGTAGTDFKLESVSTGAVYLEDGTTSVAVDKSNINDTTGKKQIACYWNIANGQLLKAIAPDGYHWEQLMSDGSSVRVSDAEEYLFVASTNIKLVAKSGTGNANTAVLIDEFCFDDNRNDSILRFNGQVICAENEELISCGLTFTDFNNHGEIPSIYCGASETVTATAWNSTTGQFVVEFSIEGSPEYVIRGYAIVRNTVTDEYFVRYSDCVASVF